MESELIKGLNCLKITDELYKLYNRELTNAVNKLEAAKEASDTKEMKHWSENIEILKSKIVEINERRDILVKYLGGSAEYQNYMLKIGAIKKKKL